MLSEPSYGHFVILSQGHAFHPNGHISETGPQNKKIKVLYFLKLLKFEKAKCLYFCIICFLSRVMAILWFCPRDMLFIKIRKWPYLGLESIKCKNKVTLLSQTLKVGEKKVPLFFCFAASFPRYGHFMKKHVPGTKSENGHISA